MSHIASGPEKPSGGNQQESSGVEDEESPEETDEEAVAGTNDPSPGAQKVLLGVGWTLVTVPLVYGLVSTVIRASALFTG